MKDDTSQAEKAYWTKDVADDLGMAVTTVRKYASLMEENGYTILRNEHNQRAFLERDILIMKRIKSLAKAHGVTIEDAVNSVLKGVPSNEVQTVSGSDTSTMSPPDTKENEQLQALITRYDDKFNDLKNDNDELKGMIQELQQIVKGQQSYIDDSIKKRDEQLLQSIRELHQARIEAASTEKKGFFSRLFKKESL
ncbi:MerR family transcriptional regulator [Metabacillus rhizolycopersici]|uniref:MerR family transcriptional regulator n=1 Tax=Metabacillus rhizolycopersici TaxID=2875709 RepID=A0ABS7UZG1_9BACI|nr:MerR family transcriptional regulator [Metabacillus rhizolycopersici]MBZ5753711.1 MerR family transcriptional regulator [Metabacillus rhizolycopersici]